MKYAALFCWLLVLWSAITSTVVAQDSNTVRIRHLGNGVYYVGLGPSANYSPGAIDSLLPGEVEDTDPLRLEFGNDALTDSAKIEVRARYNSTTGRYRVVMKNTTAGHVISNITFRPTSTVGVYELDIPGTPIGNIDPVDSVFAQTLKWVGVGTYLTTAQLIIAGHPDCPCEDNNTSCIAHYPHNDECSGLGEGGSGPFNINRVKVLVLCAGTQWVDVRHCCRDHDRSLWCTPLANRGAMVQIINLQFWGCLAVSVANYVTNNVPWYCGGAVVGAITGAAQGTLIGAAAWLGVTIWTNGQLIGDDNCYISAGHELNSCLCGGDVQTLKCDTKEEMCEGLLGSVDFIDDVCFCDDNPKTMEIGPVMPGASYTWHTSGSVTATQDPLNPHKASVTATGSGTVTVVMTIPGCNISRTYTRKITRGAPPKPVITTHGGATPICIPRRPGTLLVADRHIDKEDVSCPTEYKLVVTSNAGSSVVYDIDVASGNWSTHADWVLAAPNIQNLLFCVYIIARNECGESLPTVYCVEVDDDCHHQARIIGETSGVPLESANYHDIGLLYPNPSTGRVTLTVDEADLGSPITIADAGGSIVGTFVAGSVEQALAVEDLPQGMYIVTLETSKGPVSRPLVIVR